MTHLCPPNRPRPRGIVRPPFSTWPSALLLLAAAACSDGAVEGADPKAKPDDAVLKREIRDLITATTPPPASVTIGEEHAWFKRRSETLERLRNAGPEMGREALEAYRARPDALAQVRSALLDVAAHGLPEETRPILVELIQEYGDEPQLRRDSCHFLAQTSPSVAIEVLEPILATRQRDRTYPADEQMIAAYTAACEAVGHDPTDLLASIAVDILRPQDARHRAVRELKNHKSPKTQQALELLMVESGGNNYIRRLATQSLEEVSTKEEFCARIRRVLENEVDPTFSLFLNDMLEKSCR